MKTMRNKIDFKSVIIGALAALLLMSFMSAKLPSVYDVITCKSITIVDDNGKKILVMDNSANGKGGGLTTYNKLGNITGFFGTNVNGNGQARFKDSTGTDMVFVGYSTTGGVVDIYTPKGKLAGSLISDENAGWLDLYDENESKVVMLGDGGVSTYNGSGGKTTYIGGSESGYGAASFYYSSGKQSVYVGNGFMQTSGTDGNKSSVMGTSSSNGGLFKAYNSSGIQVSYLGVETGSGGLLQVNDKYGTLLFEKY